MIHDKLFPIHGRILQPRLQVSGPNASTITPTRWTSWHRPATTSQRPYCRQHIRCLSNAATQLRYKLDQLRLRPQDPDYKSAIHQIQDQGLEQFLQIFSHNGKAPRSIRAIASYVDATLASDGAARSWPERNSNLSRFGDMLASLASQAETVLRINTLHNQLFSTVIFALHAYTNKPFHVHHMVSGDAAAGKSHALKLLKDLLIENTCIAVNDESAKSDAVAGNELSMQILLYEEAPMSQLGVKTNGGASGSGG
jgi:hypothetical protein